jgi:hypothetical protein
VSALKMQPYGTFFLHTAGMKQLLFYTLLTSSILSCKNNENHNNSRDKILASPKAKVSNKPNNETSKVL